MITRRGLLKSAAAMLTSGSAVGLYSWQIEPHWVEIVRLPLPVAHLPPGLAGATLVQLSDLHVGLRVSDDYITGIFARVKALAPDIVAYTGDFVSHAPDVVAHAARVYDGLPKGRLATVGILGNHDYGRGWANGLAADRLTGLLRELGITMLRNEVTEVDGLQIVGMDDLWAGRFAPALALGQVELSRAAIALSHNPETVDRPGWEGFQGWILSGHTHGGQCKPPFLPPPLLPVLNERYTAGAFELQGGRRLYISRGVGHLLQLRFNVRPEVTVFELRPA